ncbi:DUF4350 domain-containing protein [Streptomyces sp. NPDC048639]|uniref:DUF4350 domain-containing protein n=1 Tax=Streptomyces sp. NPDC048639 TaxID=3365581 RepID=UPI0037233D59
MTAAATVSTSTSPTGRQMWTRSRGLLLGFAILVIAGVILAVLRSGEQRGLLDPRSADRYGSRAVAELLADRGVSTEFVTTTDAATAAARPGTTVLIAEPDRLTEGQQRKLHGALGKSGGRTVLVGAGESSAGALAPGVRAAEPVDVGTRSPGCDLSAAERAGKAELGGNRYDSSGRDADACYRSGGLPTLLRMPGANGGDTVLLGSPDILFNDRLAKEGNASLALQLLGSHDHLVWYLPSLSDTAAGEGDRSFTDLIPEGWHWAVLQLTVAAVLAALWRARRLGPLVTERLPVVIRASEATEGRARLYRKANARDRAAEALRSATRTRLAPLVGVPAAAAHSRQDLVPAVSGHLPLPAPDIDDLLFGPAPADDSALVRLADELDELEHRITSSSTRHTDSVSAPHPASPPIERDRTP